MTVPERAKLPLMFVGWPLIVVPVIYVVVDALRGQSVGDVPYLGSYGDLVCIVVGGAIVGLASSWFRAVLATAIATGLVTLTGLIGLIEVAIRVGASGYLGAQFYLGNVLFVLAGIAVTVGLGLLVSVVRPPRPTGMYPPGYASHPGYPPQGYPPQGYQQQGYSPGYAQPGHPPQQTGYQQPVSQPFPAPQQPPHQWPQQGWTQQTQQPHQPQQQQQPQQSSERSGDPTQSPPDEHWTE